MSAWGKIRRGINIAGRVFLALIVLAFIYLVVIYPLARGCWLRHQLLTALDDAKEVRVVEHSSPLDRRDIDADNKPVTYGTVKLTSEQLDSLQQAFPVRLDYSATAMLKCIFEEHHYIEIVEKDGSVQTLHICFHCGEIKLNDERIRMMPMGWHSSLSQFISSIGMHPEGPWDKRKP